MHDKFLVKRGEESFLDPDNCKALPFWNGLVPLYGYYVLVPEFDCVLSSRQGSFGGGSTRVRALARMFSENMVIQVEGVSGQVGKGKHRLAVGRPRFVFLLRESF